MIPLDLQPELEAQLAAEAQARGLALDASSKRCSELSAEVKPANVSRAGL